MNKCIILVVLAFAAVACASPKPGYSAPSYHSAPVYAKPDTYSAPSSAAAAAAAASSAANPGYLYQVNGYDMLSNNYGYGHGPYGNHYGGHYGGYHSY